MIRCFLAALFGLLAAGAALAAEPPQRIVSLNKCTDQLLLALVERERIASVSPIGSDELSFSAKALRGLPANSGRGESVLLTNADLVLTGPFESHARRDMLRRQGFEVLVLGLWTSLAEGREQIRVLAQRLGAEAKGAALIAAIDAALARSRGAAPAPRTVLVLQRRGYTPGDTSILDELLRHVGLVPATRWLGLAQGGTVSLERLVADPPDYLLMAESDRGAIDQGSALLWHPALRATIPPERRLYLPDRLTICGGPATPQAIDALAAEVRAKVR
ncbi:MAG TPA: ABC transporter substrate-binding protein [Beijerinckiaceae bacterium]|nr:ABC transporter substrate-binding protein [Beijerinckiaceae bacterium]